MFLFECKHQIISCTSVKIKEDVPGNYQIGLLPILDTQVCVKEGRILFHHLHKAHGFSGNGNVEIQHEYQCEIKYPDPRSLQKAEELQSKHQLEHKGSSNKQTDVADEKLWLWRETESDCCKESHGKVLHQPEEPSQST